MNLSDQIKVLSLFYKLKWEIGAVIHIIGSFLLTQSGYKYIIEYVSTLEKMKNNNPQIPVAQPEPENQGFPLPILSQTEPLDQSEDGTYTAYQKIRANAGKLYSVTSCEVSESTKGKVCLRIRLRSQMSETELYVLKGFVGNVHVLFSRETAQFPPGKTESLPTKTYPPRTLLGKGFREF